MARVDHPDDLRLMRLHAQALNRAGKAIEGIAILESAIESHADDPFAYIALAQTYSDADRGPQAVKVLQDAQAKFPQDNAIAFELGSVFDKQKKFADAEAAFRQVLTREPENAAALNYLGYMLAERGERLDESVNYLKKALQIEPENGSFLDSLGWAYFKAERADLAEDNLRSAADQLKGNSVIQDHYGDVLFKLGRYDGCDRRLDARAVRGRRFDRSRRDRQEDPIGQTKSPEEMSAETTTRQAWRSAFRPAIARCAAPKVRLSSSLRPLLGLRARSDEASRRPRRARTRRAGRARATPRAPAVRVSTHHG